MKYLWEHADKVIISLSLFGIAVIAFGIVAINATIKEQELKAQYYPFNNAYLSGYNKGYTDCKNNTKDK